MITGLDYRTGEPIVVTISDGRIASINPLPPSSTTTSATLPLLGPGLFDLQVNGANGVDFNELGAASSPPGSAASAAKWLAAHGTTRFLATFITAPEASLLRALRALAAEADAALPGSPLYGALAGVHLEGPFISACDGFRGAHPAKDVVSTCDWESFERAQAASGGRVRLVTLAPELPGAEAFIARAVASGVAVALGHTAADAVTFAAAAAAGASIFTHLGNGLPGMLPRHLNPIWEALACDALSPSLIADGHHLPPAILAVALRAARTPFLVSDATSFTGALPGRYESNIGGVVDLGADGRLTVAGGGGNFAGAALPLASCVGVATASLSPRAASLAIARAAAWDLASLAPAVALAGGNRAAAVTEPRGLEVGAAADIVAFDWDSVASEPRDCVRVRSTWIAGYATVIDPVTTTLSPPSADSVISTSRVSTCTCCGGADAFNCTVCGALAIACGVCAARGWRAHVGLGGDGGVGGGSCSPPALVSGPLGGVCGLRGAIAIVTGGSGGMGPVIGSALAARGVGTIIFAQRDCARAAGAVALVLAHGSTCTAMRLDISSREGVGSFFADFTARHGRLDILVNVAGDCPRTAIGDVDEAEFEAVARVNAAGPLWMVQAARRLMWTSGGGAIVNIGSLAGEDGANAASIAYSMAKAGLRGLMMQLSKEGFAPGTPAGMRGSAPLVRCNNVSPGPVATEMLKSMDPARLAAITAATLTGRVTAIEEVAAAVVFLALDGINVTGQTLNLSGGLVRR